MLILGFAQEQLGKLPTVLKLADITPELILVFLDYLEQERYNAVRSRNVRLAALRAFLKFASHREVSPLLVIEQALGVPMKRFELPMIGFLSREVMLTVIRKPGITWFSQRDHLLPALLYNSGARVFEIIGVRVEDVVLDGAAHVHLHGKGRNTIRHTAAMHLLQSGVDISVIALWLGHGSPATTHMLAIRSVGFWCCN
jgi:site-specific recombinase XerD